MSSIRQKAPANKTAKEPSLIYCGPNLPKGVLNQFTVFQNGISKHIDSYIEECPAIKRLIVPVDEFTSFVSKSTEPGTSEHVWFDQVLSKYYGGVN